MRFVRGVPALLALSIAILGTTAVRAADPGLDQRLSHLEAEVQAAEDVSAIKRLQRTYGYFLDKGLWTDLAEYFTDDAVANYPAGVFVGKQSIREHLYRNVGNVPMGQVGLGENRLYNHMSLQPVVHLDPGGRTASGRWRALAMFGSLGGGATWAEGVYELRYAKQNGVWKISKLDYYAGFGAPYATGWVAPATPGSAPATPRPRRQLAHPADREHDASCDGFPAACIAPFHYANPGKGAGSPVWVTDAAPGADGGNARARSGLALARLQRLEAEQQIENLQRIYGYYLDRAYWDQVADLFADDATLEMGQQGVYVGKRRIREYLGKLGPHGLVPGWMNDHVQLQPVVTVSADGRHAWLRSREWSMTGHYERDGQWSEGLYENRFVKDNGVWKIAALRYYPTFITAYEQGWGKDAQPAPGPLADLPPDRPPSTRYEIYPHAHVPPFHYPNPVTGQPVHYPQVGGPDARTARAALADAGRVKAVRVKDVAASVAEAERLVDRVKSVHEIENLESAYGFYLDKNLWTDLADLFDPVQGSIELAHRGIYRGAKVRSFLVQVFGRGQEGPVAGRLGNHVQMQSVISLAPDGRSAQIRQRMFQQMNQGARASIGGAIYENEAVRGADGVWRFSKVNAWNTFSAGYEGGWAKAAGRGMPGPNPEIVPPDAPPSRQIAMFPVVYEIPYHYANPVTGRTDLPPLVPMAQQLKDYPLPPPPAPRVTSAPAGMPAEVASALREIGPRIEGAKTTALYAPLLALQSHEGIDVSRDLAYGPHARHRVDVFRPNARGERRPMVVFIHGGGFSRGAKSAPGSPFYDNIGYWAASHGLVGVTLNYRLAPEFAYPSGAEDLARAVAWLRSHAADWGADPRRIVLWGHSAGAAHVGDYLARTPRPLIAGAVLTSGIFDLGSTVSVWKDYYGDDVARYAERSSLARLAKVPTPLLVTWAELDPPDFVPDTEKLIAQRKAAGRPLTSLRLPNHSHLSETYAVGTADESLSGPVLQFIQSTKP
jgi:triacylglycerol lipase